MIGTKTLRFTGENIRVYRLCLHELNYYRQNPQILLFLPTNVIVFMPMIKLGIFFVTFFQQFAYNHLQCTQFLLIPNLIFVQIKRIEFEVMQ